MMHSSQFKQQMLKAWTSFVKGESLEENIIRGEIHNSWIRSQRYGVDPLKENCPILTWEEIAERRERRQELLEIASPYMRNLYNFVKGSGFIVVLTDEEGYVLESLGDKEVLNSPVSSVVGAARSEELIGTNGVGTAIYLDKPMQIWAEENFSECYHDWTCSGAPIHDKSGNIIGCIDLSGYWDKAHAHTLGMVIAASDAIERTMHLNQAYNDMTTISNLQKTTLESISEGIIVIDLEEKIIHINNYASRILNIRDQSIIGSKLSRYIHYQDYFKNIMDNEISIIDREVKFNTPSGLLNCTLSAKTYKNDENKICGLVITLRDIKNVHKLVNRMIGSSAFFNFNSIIGTSKKVKESIRLGKIASTGNVNVLLLGESGTGKEMYAQAIHNSSERSGSPFIAINCGALPRSLIESELFGYEGGAFTGSRKEGHPGKFELADGGTIFLDEIGDMPIEVQVVLLRVLQNKEVMRIGGTKAKKIDVRIIAATNTDLESAIKNRTFREDLYYRLNVLSIKIPPLRERKDDILPLMDHFIQKYKGDLNKDIEGFGDGVIETLCKYDWHGNVRELENTIERAVNISQNNLISLEDLPPNLLESPTHHKRAVYHNESEIEVIKRYLNKNKGNIRKTAQELGFARSTIYRKMRENKLNLEDYRQSTL